MEIGVATLNQALDALGQLLEARGYHYEVVAVGGGALLLLGHIIRPTRDLGLIAVVTSSEFISANPLPPILHEAAVDVGIAFNLTKEWFNPGPAALFEMGLPEGFKSRMQTRTYGGGLTLHLAGRFDQICFKLYAAVDQGPLSKHFADLKSLKPTEAELLEAGRWCITHDVSEEFAATLQEALRALGVQNANP